ncbi:cation:proton antiporter [Aquipuribacter nitratireducens]|uniref:Cation:proton antiporter n=1 Tax=Aquipuribacter nitratireducens TaxID=650104 RepID=A0ABW0GUS5_9MICO
MALDHTAVLLLELGALVVGLSLLAGLAARLDLPAVPLYLVAGLALGQGGLVAPTESEAFLATAAEVGVLLLLLSLGLEFSAEELVGTLRRQAPVGGLDLVLNGVPGVVAGLLLGLGPAGALALGGVTYISSSGVVAKALRDLGRLGNRETPAVLGVLVIEDLAMAVYLPVLTVVVTGAGLLAGLGVVAVAVGVVTVVLVVALRHGPRLTRLLPVRPELLTLAVVGLTLLVAGIAEAAQVSAAVGAFLVGVAVSGDVADKVRDLLAPLRDLFAAVFFVWFGIGIDPTSLLPVLAPAAVLAAVTAATKVATGWVAAGREGVGPRGRLRAGTALVPRGEFSIVVAGLAAPALGAAGAVLAALSACYVLLLAVGGPLLMRVSDPVADRLRLGAHRARGVT